MPKLSCPIVAIRWYSTPFRSVSMRNMVRPWFLRSWSDVRARISSWWLSAAMVVKAFEPFRRNPPLTLRARVRSAPSTSVPPPGSVNDSAIRCLPSAIAGRIVLRCSSVPCRARVCAEWVLMDQRVARPPSWRPSCSSTIDCSTIPPPAPPYSFGTASPCRPASDSASHSAKGNVFVSSASRIAARSMRSSANERAKSCSSVWSWVKVKVDKPVSFRVSQAVRARGVSPRWWSPWARS